MMQEYTLKPNEHLGNCIEYCISRAVQLSYSFLAETSQVQILTDILEDELATFDIDRFTTFLNQRNIPFDVSFDDNYFSITLW